jgi:hypothetical protein
MQSCAAAVGSMDIPNGLSSLPLERNTGLAKEPFTSTHGQFRVPCVQADRRASIHDVTIGARRTDDRRDAIRRECISMAGTSGTGPVCGQPAIHTDRSSAENRDGTLRSRRSSRKGPPDFSGLRLTRISRSTGRRPRASPAMRFHLHSSRTPIASSCQSVGCEARVESAEIPVGTEFDWRSSATTQIRGPSPATAR